MSAKRIITIVLGVAAAAWLSASPRDLVGPPRAGPELPPIALPMRPRPAEAFAASAELRQQPDDDASYARESDSAAAQTPITVPGSVDASEPWGQDFEECMRKNRVAISVCKHRFEPRDPDWAPEAEQGIRAFVAETPLLRLSEDVPQHLDCRTTFCQLYLDIDRAGLTDRLRSIGRYNDDALVREHEFAYLTISSRWAHDRAEELRLALVFSGHLEEDSEVVVSAFEPAYREQDSFLEFEFSRCAKRNDFC